MAMGSFNSQQNTMPTAEINMTPLVDVMLVLLIIFMVAAPLATVDIKVDLPASSAKPAPRPEKPVFLSVKADQRLFLGEEEVKAETLGPVLVERGLLLVGVDVIGDSVTEINVTSPTCFQEIADQTGCNVAALFVDALEAAIAQKS